MVGLHENRGELLRRLEQTPAIETLLADAEKARRNEAADARKAAFVELQRVEAEAESFATRAGKELAAALAAEKKAEAATLAAIAVTRKLRRKNSAASGAFERRRQACLRAIEGVVPEQCEEFLRWADAELKRLVRIEPTVQESTRETEGWGFRTGVSVVLFHGNGPSISRRIEAVSKARVKAREMALQDLDENELARKLGELRDGLPQIEFEPLAGRPASTAPMLSGGESKFLSVAEVLAIGGQSTESN